MITNTFRIERAFAFSENDFGMRVVLFSERRDMLDNNLTNAICRVNEKWIREHKQYKDTVDTLTDIPVA